MGHTNFFGQGVNVKKDWKLRRSIYGVCETEDEAEYVSLYTMDPIVFLEDSTEKR